MNMMGMGMGDSGKPSNGNGNCDTCGSNHKGRECATPPKGK